MDAADQVQARSSASIDDLARQVEAAARAVARAMHWAKLKYLRHGAELLVDATTELKTPQVARIVLPDDQRWAFSGIPPYMDLPPIRRDDPSPPTYALEVVPLPDVADLE